jgi:hypothetical protein
MSTTIINAETEAAHAERWRQWQLTNAETSRTGAVRARIVHRAVRCGDSVAGYPAVAGALGLMRRA